MKRNIRAALFDLDGVVFDTESQYSVFWGDTFKRYYPNESGLEQKIKGQTLVQIFDGFFAGKDEVQADIIKGLNNFEAHMSFKHIAGFEAFMRSLKANGVKTAVVTSSNKAKMEAVYAAHTDFKNLFDAILTSEDFEFSKPHPDCYLKGAQRFGMQIEECVVFEDSFNGLKSGQAAGMSVIGLATTNSSEAILPYCNRAVADFTSMDYNALCEML